MTSIVNQVEMTVGIVKSYVSANSVPQADLPKLLNEVYRAVSNLTDPARQEPEPADRPTPAVPVSKSITNDFLVCLDDGKKFKSLKRHLASLGMTPSEYRAKWSLSADYPMVAPNYSAKRSQLAKNIGLGHRATA